MWLRHLNLNAFIIQNNAEIEEVHKFKEYNAEEMKF